MPTPKAALVISRYHLLVAQLIVRQLEEDVKLALQRRAKANGRSTEAEVREILRAAVYADDHAPVGLGTAIAARFAGIGLAEDIPELRGNPVRPITFDE